MATNRRKKPPAPKRQAKPALPFWVWLLCAAVAGFVFAEIIPIVTHHSWPHVHPPSQPQPRVTAALARPPKAKKAAPHFDFYNMLPKSHVAVPHPDEAAQPQPHQAPEKGKSPVLTQGVYVLQVGSFRNYADADRLRAHLALLGVESRVKKTRTQNGQTWNRVRIGPIKTLKRLHKIRAELRQKNIEPMVVRVNTNNH